MNENEKKIRELEKCKRGLTVLLTLAVIICLALSLFAYVQYNLVNETKQQLADNYNNGYSVGYDEGKTVGYDKAKTKYEAKIIKMKEEAKSNTASKSKSKSSSSYASNYSNSSSDYSSGSGTTVYITDTGSCYHYAGCSYLRSSSHAISLEEAESEGYRPCSRCCY